MNSIEMISPAKINIFLNVLNKREDGFHNISTIMQSISLHDKISIEKNHTNDIKISSNERNIPLGKKNIAWKAANALLSELNLKKGYNIYIEKNIPWCAGLGGASSNAAAVINGILKIENIEMDIKEKIRIVQRIGSDIPFFFYGGTCIAESKGEKIKPITNIDKLWLLIVKPKEGISTVKAYNEIDKDKDTSTREAKEAIKEIEKIKFKNIKEIMYNVFEPIAQKKCKDITRIKDELKECGADIAQMTGSGSAIFAIFETEDSAKDCAEKMKTKNRRCYISHTIDCGIIMSGYKNTNLKWSEIYA